MIAHFWVFVVPSAGPAGASYHTLKIKELFLKQVVTIMGGWFMLKSMSRKISMNIDVVSRAYLRYLLQF